ncbi:MAG: hypothetical protein ACTSP9_06555 [Promethearchaeota archaeon]
MIKKYIKKHWDSGFDFFLAVGQGIIFTFSMIGIGIKTYEGIKKIRERKAKEKRGVIILK